MDDRNDASNKTEQPQQNNEQSPVDPLANRQIERRLPIAAIPIQYTIDQVVPQVALPNDVYEITDPKTKLIGVVHINHELHGKISAAMSLLQFGFSSPRLPYAPKTTWPQKWRYLAQAQLDGLEKDGLCVLTQKHILLESLEISSFAKYLYFPKNVPIFFDTWIEIIWQEYVLESELRKFQALQAHGQGVDKISGQSNEVTLHNADMWILLENCVIRIRSIWERLRYYIFPLYFIGVVAPDERNKEYWQNLREEAIALMNQEQKDLCAYLFKAVTTATNQNNTLKNMRDALIHSLSHRPAGIVPASISGTSNLPKTVSELHELVLDERSHVREALVLMAAIIRAKTPENKRVTLTI